MLLKEPEKDLLYSTIEGESILFSIGDPSIIIDIIRKKIYSYPIRTLVQEYLSNAKDACIEAGKPYNEIEVTLPTSLKPEFCVRDFGVGMSDERVSEVFVRYGISTKRESNKQIGCFGIGAKSGWSYSDSFIVESFYNGIHRHYIADIAQTREGRLLLYKESPTNEPNGVLIRIPAESKDIDTFKKSYLRTTFLWDKRPKLLNGDVSYPELLFDLGDIRVYKHFLVDCGVYLDANGIPFFISSLSDSKKIKESLDALQRWCREFSLALVIKADPVKMDISANREGFANQTYATTRVEYAYQKLQTYIADGFANSPYKEYFAIYGKLYPLTKLYNAFKNKPYSIKTWGSTEDKNISFNLNTSIDTKGYFLKLERNTVFRKKVVLEIYFKYDAKSDSHPLAEVYLSRSPALVDFKKILTPFLLPETKKAITFLRAFNLNGIQKYIFFQNSLTNEEYAEMAEILGAVEYVEDVYEKHLVEYTALRKQERLERKKELDGTKKEKKKKDNEIKVYRFKRHGRGTLCAKDLYYPINIESLLDTNNIVFYGIQCKSYVNELLLNLPIELIAVAVDKKNIIKIEQLNNPRFKSIDDVDSYIRSNKEILSVMNDIRDVKSNMYFWKFFRANKIVSRQFNIDALYIKVANILRHIQKIEDDHRSYNVSVYSNFLRDFPEVSDFRKFFNTYPLLKELTYDIKSSLLPDINIYIKGIDEISEASHGHQSSSNEQFTNSNSGQ